MCNLPRANAAVSVTVLVAYPMTEQTIVKQMDHEIVSCSKLYGATLLTSNMVHLQRTLTFAFQTQASAIRFQTWIEVTYGA